MEITCGMGILPSKALRQNNLNTFEMRRHKVPKQNNLKGTGYFDPAPNLRAAALEGQVD